MNMTEAAAQAAADATKALPLSLLLWQLRFSILSLPSEISVALDALTATAGQSSRLTQYLVQQLRANETKQFGNTCSEETASKLQSWAVHFAAGSKDEAFSDCSATIFDAAMWSASSSGRKPVDSIFGCALHAARSCLCH